MKIYVLSSQSPEIEWQNTIGGFSTDDLYSIHQTFDGGYILGGASASGVSGDKTQPFIGEYDYWVVKLDILGNIEWQKTIGGNNNDWLYCVKQTFDGGYILGGTSDSDISGNKTEENLGGSDYWIVKLNAVGNIQWQKAIGGSSDDILKDLCQTFDGSYILGGYSYSGISGDKTESNSGGTDYWIINIDNLGNIVWQKTIGGSLNDVLSSIQNTSDSGYVAFGTSISGISGDKTEPSIQSPFETNTDDYWVIKLNNLGNIQWQNTIGGNSNDEAGNIKQTPDGGYILCGYSRSGISGDKSETLYGVSDYWVVKLNSLGLIEWQNTIGGIDDDGSNGVKLALAADNGYILGGNSISGISIDKTEATFGFYDYWIVKIDTSGLLMWDKTLGGSEYDILRDLNKTSDGGVILGGWSNSNISGNKLENTNGDADFWVIKLEGNCTPEVYYLDNDNDGYGNSLITVSACNPPFGYVTDSTDCVDTNVLIFPGATEFCNSLDDNCNLLIDEGLALNTYYLDADEDGYGNVLLTIASCSDVPPTYYSADSTDCDDDENLIHEPILYYADMDSDLFGDEFSVSFFCSLEGPAGFVLNNTDCNDLNALINPSIIEICNDVDDNCNNLSDEGLILVALYKDFDNDNYGNNLIDTISCFSEISGYVADSTDCDDLNANVFPGASEILNGIDDDCDNMIDEGLVEIKSISTFQFNIYPNPNNGIFEIKINNIITGNIIVEIFDLSGANIYTKTFNSTDRLYISLPEIISGTLNVVILADKMFASELISILK